MPIRSEWQRIRHQVAIGGVVTNVAGARVARAVVTVDFPGAPTGKRKATPQTDDAAAEAPSEALDRTESRTDGSFFFLDLPDGTYTVSATHPQFEKAEQQAVVKHDEKIEDKITMASVDLKLIEKKKPVVAGDKNDKGAMASADLKLVKH